jgi:hypothetical protein
MRRSNRLIGVVGLVMSAAGAGACSSGSDGQSVVTGVQAMVFVKRAYINVDGDHDVTGGVNQVIDYGRYVPGGGLFVLQPPTPRGALREITASFEGVDINGVDLSFDAKQVVFSMRHRGDDRYHLYLANVDGSGSVEQLTNDMDSDDIKPVFVPGDLVAFVSNKNYTEMGTRADEYNHAPVVTQITTISLTRKEQDRRVCSQNLSHSADPFLMADGSVGFSRWEHLGPVNDVKLFRMNPDCSQMVALAGQHGKPSNSLVQVREVQPGVLVGVATSREKTIQAGALVRVDARNTQGLERIAFDEQNARMELLTPSVPTGEESSPSGQGRYRSPHELPGTSRMLVSWANGDVNERNELAATAPNFGIYLWDPERQTRALVYDDPEMWDLYAIPVVPREAPVVKPSVVSAQLASSLDTTPAILGSIDITQTSLNEVIRGGQFGEGTPLGEALAQATRVRVIEGFSGEIGGVGQFGLTMHEGAAILGEAPVQSDFSWEAQVPPFLPYHLQPLDRFGMSIRNQMLWIQAMPGENRRCGGCHESRTQTVQARSGTTTLAQQAPVNLMRSLAERTELPWAGVNADAAGDTGTAYSSVQALLDAKCVGCHSGGDNDPFAGRGYTISVASRLMGAQAAAEPRAYTIPWLNLSSSPLSVEYEREVVQYPASYVTLLYPSAMMGDVTVTSGEIPNPPWVVPGAARESRLIAKVNINAENNPGEWAFPLKAGATAGHPEDVGGPSLTRDERLMLIRMVDLGGQYYSRRNNPGGFIPYTANYQ